MCLSAGPVEAKTDAKALQRGDGSAKIRTAQDFKVETLTGKGQAPRSNPASWGRSERQRTPARESGDREARNRVERPNQDRESCLHLRRKDQGYSNHWGRGVRRQRETTGERS